jgi:hypothetical protein
VRKKYKEERELQVSIRERRSNVAA